MAAEDLTATFAKNIQLREEIKLYQKDLKTLALYDLEQSRKDSKQAWQLFLETRD